MDQVQVYKAYLNGAKVSFGTKLMNHPKFDSYSNYRIANKSKDGINFHCFIERLEEDCSNLMCMGEESAYTDKKLYIEEEINRGCSHLSYYSLKKEEKYRACETVEEAFTLEGKSIKRWGELYGRIIGITASNSFIVSTIETARVNGNINFYSFHEMFSHFTERNGSKLGIKL